MLGATGSIGTQTLDIIKQYPDRFSACALAAYSNAEKLFALAREYRPEFCALVKQAEIPEDLKNIGWFFGETAASDMLKVCGAQDALCAVVGIAGLPTVLTALDYCERVLLANKEALVTGGALVTEKARRLGKPILPDDSELSAIFQCLKAADGNAPERIILTCSGGALRDRTAQELENATVSDVLKHPTWNMGGKITVDCATLMNKGLEVIEAHHLFNMPLDRISVVIHPQSVIHSMVEFCDNAVLAQLGMPDMRGPISYAMGYPERLNYKGKRLDFELLNGLTFQKPDTQRFPCLKYAIEAQRAGGSAPVMLNGANEVAVRAFLEGKIKFGSISRIVKRTLEAVRITGIGCVEDVYAADAEARRLAAVLMEGVE